MSTCDVFNCLFLLDVQNEIQLLSRCLLLFMAGLFTGFLVEKRVACQKFGNSISDGIVFVVHLA